MFLCLTRLLYGQVSFEKRTAVGWGAIVWICWHFLYENRFPEAFKNPTHNPKYINNQKRHFNIHKILTNMFRPAFRLSSEWLFYARIQTGIPINEPIRCNSFPSLLLDVYVRLNMFRAYSRPSSGAQQLQ